MTPLYRSLNPPLFKHATLPDDNVYLLCCVWLDPSLTPLFYTCRRPRWKPTDIYCVWLSPPLTPLFYTCRRSLWKPTVRVSTVSPPPLTSGVYMPPFPMETHRYLRVCVVRYGACCGQLGDGRATERHVVEQRQLQMRRRARGIGRRRRIHTQFTRLALQRRICVPGR